MDKEPSFWGSKNTGAALHYGLSLVYIIDICPHTPDRRIGSIGYPFSRGLFIALHHLGDDSEVARPKSRSFSALGVSTLSHTFGRLSLDIRHLPDQEGFQDEGQLEGSSDRDGRQIMRLLSLSDGWTVLLCFAAWGFFQFTAALVCMNIPDRHFSNDSWFYRSHPFEQGGRIYARLFKVHRWKHLLPDGGALWKKNGFRKRSLEDYSEENLRRFLIESARGEMTHWLAIFPFWVFGFFTPTYVIWIMLAYALAANLPCIIAQRYNRPRVLRLLEKIKRNTS